jgi:hypothetical protein
LIKKITHILTIILLLLLTKHIHAQKFLNGINAGAKVGASKLLGEMAPDISGMIQEFDNSYSMSYDIELSKYLGNHWEIGVEFGQSQLAGDIYNPNFSAEGWHYSMPGSIDDPVEYKNKLLSQRFFVSYYFRELNNNKSGININPFLRAGLGHLIYKCTLKYMDAPDNEFIYGKGTDRFSNDKLTTAVYFASAGIKATLSNKLFVLATANFNYVGYDLLDVVYNFTEEGERMNASGIYSEFKMGLFYSFGNFSGKSNNKSSKKKARGKAGNTINYHLPFAPKI